MLRQQAGDVLALASANAFKTVMTIPAVYLAFALATTGEVEDSSSALVCCTQESGHPTPASKIAAGFRMPLAEPGVRLSLRTGLSLDVYA
jgi:hypothetical protein